MRRRFKRIGIGLAGGLVVLIGIIAIPYPGPGLLIVFTGLAILATEFAGAQDVLERARRQYEVWQAWLKRQAPVIRVSVALMTGLVVVVTMYLLNIYGLVDDWLHLGFDWLHSPLPFFK